MSLTAIVYLYTGLINIVR